jgi:hypothetical protein
MNILPQELPSQKAGGSTDPLKANLSKLGPLKQEGTVGFHAFRDVNSASPTKKDKNAKTKKGKTVDSDEESSDDETDAASVKADDVATDTKGKNLLSPDDIKKGEEMAEGVRKIKLKRQHSFDPPDYHASTSGDMKANSASPAPLSSQQSGRDPSPLNAASSAASPNSLSKPLTPPTTSIDSISSPSAANNTGSTSRTPPPLIAPFSTPMTGTGSATPGTLNNATSLSSAAVDSSLVDPAMIGSPLKRHRASIPGLDESANELRRRFGFGAANHLTGNSASGDKTNSDDPTGRHQPPIGGVGAYTGPGLGVSMSSGLPEALGGPIQSSGAGSEAGKAGGIAGQGGPLSWGQLFGKPIDPAAPSTVGVPTGVSSTAAAASASAATPVFGGEKRPGTTGGDDEMEEEL